MVYFSGTLVKINGFRQLIIKIDKVTYDKLSKYNVTWTWKPKLNESIESLDGLEVDPPADQLAGRREEQKELEEGQQYFTKLTLNKYDQDLKVIAFRYEKLLKKEIKIEADIQRFTNKKFKTVQYLLCRRVYSISTQKEEN